MALRRWQPGFHVLSANLHRRHTDQGPAGGDCRGGPGLVLRRMCRVELGQIIQQRQSPAILPVCKLSRIACSNFRGWRAHAAWPTSCSQVRPGTGQQVTHGEISLPKAVEQVTGRSGPPEAEAEACRASRHTGELDGLREKNSKRRARRAVWADRVDHPGGHQGQVPKPNA